MHASGLPSQETVVGNFLILIHNNISNSWNQEIKKGPLLSCSTHHSNILDNSIPFSVLSKHSYPARSQPSHSQIPWFHLRTPNTKYQHTLCSIFLMQLGTDSQFHPIMSLYILSLTLYQPTKPIGQVPHWLNFLTTYPTHGINILLFIFCP